MEKIIYLDNAATTKPFSECLQIYQECLTNFYNPSAVYQPAVLVRKKIETARANICKYLHGENGTIIFTSSATEADNLALSCFKPRANNSLAIFVGEHPAVFSKAKELENKGARVVYIPMGFNGSINDIEKYIDNTTAFLSVMYVSNETGSINDIAKIVKDAKRINPKVIIHIDAVQAFGKININVQQLGIDMLTISAHKIYGPKGVGALWVKKGINVSPIIWGGGQENNYRSGTENVAGILCLEYCAKKVTQELNENYLKVSQYKQQLLKELSNNNIEYKVNGENTTPYTLSITFENIRGEVLLHSLEKYKIYISTGSACSSKKPDNRTLKAMGLTDKQIQGTVRISFSPYEDIDIKYVADVMAQEIKLLQNKIVGK